LEVVRLAAFCVVANIADQTAHGEGGLEPRRGVKHFPPGAKVWVLLRDMRKA
jgi:hypothetical protein